MMVTTSPSANLIEQLINEFNYPSTNNNRKHEIERKLIELQHEPTVWSECLHKISTDNCPNQYLWLFNASTVEFIITRKWSTISDFEHKHIRDTLWNTYVHIPAGNRNGLHVKRGKLAQLISMIGKREFPDDNPAYILNIIELIKTKFNLGITLLRSTSEELVSTREDVPTDRKKYFHSCVSLCMSDIFELLSKFLTICVNRINPTNDLIVESNGLSHSLPNDEHFFENVQELLTCIQQLFSWIHLDDLITEQFLLNLFTLANWHSDKLIDDPVSNVSVMALTTITELFYRQSALPLPLTVIIANKHLLHQANTCKTNEVYQDVLTELLRLSSAKYWTKWINDSIFSDIIDSLYIFTFSECGALAFTERLSIWRPLIKCLAGTGFGPYYRTIHLLVSGTLEKMQFRFDEERGELEMLDNETIDDDLSTEWQHYLTQCIDTIVMIAEGRPIPVFEQVYNDWQRPFEIFMSIERYTDTVNQTLTITDPAKCNLIHCILRDLSSLCQTLARLVPILQQKVDEIPNNLTQVCFCLIEAVTFMTTYRLHNLKPTHYSFGKDFIELFAQILSVIRSLIVWSPSLLHAESNVRTIIECTSQILLPHTGSPNLYEPFIIQLSAAQLLLTVIAIVRPKYAIECTSFGQLIQSGRQLNYLDPKIINVVQQSIVNCFVLPWPIISQSEQDFERRGQLLNEYIACLGHDLLEFDNGVGLAQQEKVVKVTSSVLPSMKSILDYHKDSSSAVKLMCANAFEPIISKSIILYEKFTNSSAEISDRVLDFCISVIDTLQIQLGGVYIRRMLNVFLDTSNRRELSKNQLNSLDKQLKMLLLVVQQPGNTTLCHLPAILGLVLDVILPFLMQDSQSLDCSDVILSMYNLFDGILHHRWQFFYKSHVLRGFSPGASDASPPNDDQPAHSDRLLAILNQYGQALMSCGADPQIKHTVLQSLQSLNDRWKLFSREFFQRNLLTSFHCALINALISPEGALHIDLLLHVLFTMGQINTRQLHASFMQLGFPTNSRIVEDVCLASDLPTFSNKMSQLIQDTRCRQYTH